MHCAYLYIVHMHFAYSCMDFGILFIIIFFGNQVYPSDHFGPTDILFIIASSEQTKEYFKAWADRRLDIIEK